MTTKKLQISIIRIDGGTQMRETINSATVEEYAERIKAGDEFPPPVVFIDDDDAHWLAGGFHRVAAYRKAGETSVACDVRKGSVRDARLFAAGDNASHGLQRTNADKRLQVTALLMDPEWGKWSDREIAKRCCVGHQLVAAVRSSMDESSVENPSDEESETPTRTFKTKHGTVGKRKVPKKPEPPEPAPKSGPPKRYKDGRGVTVTDKKALEALEAAHLFDEVRDTLFEARKQLKALDKHAASTFLDYDKCLSDISSAAERLKGDRPHCQCPLMPNCTDGACKWCKGARFVSKHRFDQMPPELKEAGK